MREEFKSFFNENYLLSPHGEDDIIYTAQFANLSKDYIINMAHMAITSLRHTKQLTILGRLTFYDKYYPNANNETWSHDMMTGLSCLSKQFKMDYHNQWLWFNSWRRLQPWNIAFYLFIMDDFRHHLGLLLLPILSLYMVFNLLVHKYDENNVLQTSEQLLIWLMLNTIKMPLTKRLCDYIVKKRIGSYYEYARVYFGELHPIPILMKEQNI